MVRALTESARERTLDALVDAEDEDGRRRCITRRGRAPRGCEIVARTRGGCDETVERGSDGAGFGGGRRGRARVVIAKEYYISRSVPDVALGEVHDALGRVEHHGSSPDDVQTDAMKGETGAPRRWR